MRQRRGKVYYWVLDQNGSMSIRIPQKLIVMRIKLREKVQQKETMGLCFAKPIKFANQSKLATK